MPMLPIIVVIIDPTHEVMTYILRRLTAVATKQFKETIGVELFICFYKPFYVNPKSTAIQNRVNILEGCKIFAAHDAH